VTKMKRREFITLVGGAAAAWPVAAHAQQPARPVIGFLSGGDRDPSSTRIEALRRGLRDAGYVEGSNLAIEYRLGEGHYERLPMMAADLVRRRVAAIFTAGIPAARAAKGATATIPIVFTFGEDPVQGGIVTTLNRPDGNITGFSYFTNQLIAKRMGLLNEIVPKSAALAYLVAANNPISDPDTREAQIATAALGRELEVLTAGSDDLATTFMAMVQRHIGALAVDTVPFFLDRGDEVIALAARYRIPAIYDRREFPLAGGLMSYGANENEVRRQAGIYVGRILKGEKPGDLPVQQSTKIEFVINLKTALALGLNLAPTLVALADEVIE
jgi:putative ABC transport system substrate-binding protein